MTKKRNEKQPDPSRVLREGELAEQVQLWDRYGNPIHTGSQIGKPVELPSSVKDSLEEEDLDEWKQQLRDSEDVEIFDM